jgi:hypothetical protein
MSRFLSYLVTYFRQKETLSHLLEGENEVTIDSRLAELLNNVQYVCDPPRPRLSCVASWHTLTV